MVSTIIIAIAIYVIALPIILRLIAFTQKKLRVDRAIAKAPKNTPPKNLPKPIWPKWKKHMAFTFKDKRSFSIGKMQAGGLTNKLAFLLLYLVGLIATVVGFVIGNSTIIIIGILMFWISIMFAIMSPKKLLKKRDQIYQSLFNIAKSNLKMPAEFEEEKENYIRVLEWEEYVKPLKVEFFLPDDFNGDSAESFLKQFNQKFGTETTWVASDEEIKDENGKVTDIKPGWNFEENKVTINAVPPLPRMAKWDARYVTDPAIAWSFFPIALGVENGVELTNPETGETENVLGFDLSGLQASHGQKHGVRVADKITTSPMCLSGDTLILLEDNTTVKIKEMAESKKDYYVKTLNENNEIVVNKMFGTLKTRENARVCKILFEDGGSIVSTYDHEFMQKDGTYIKVEEFLDNTKIMGFGQEPVGVIKVEDYGKMDVYDGEVEHTHNFIIITDRGRETGVISRNCLVAGGTGGGKSVSCITPVKIYKTPGQN